MIVGHTNSNIDYLFLEDVVNQLAWALTRGNILLCGIYKKKRFTIQWNLYNRIYMRRIWYMHTHKLTYNFMLPDISPVDVLVTVKAVDSICASDWRVNPFPNVLCFFSHLKKIKFQILKWVFRHSLTNFTL